MMKHNVRTILVAIPLVVLIAGSWYYAIWTYQRNEAEIIVYVAELFERIAFPYHIARLYSEPPETALPVPVLGVRVAEITDTWSDPRAGGRMHEGVDIFAARGTPVFSATRGYVLRVGENALGGTYVLAIGPGGVRYYYAHLERVASGIRAGAAVTTDTVIGYVGNSGNAETTSPHLHFGVYAHGAENPYPLLVDRVE